MAQPIRFKRGSSSNITSTTLAHGESAAATDANNTQIATIAFVKNQNYLDGNSVIDGGTF